MTPGTRSDRRRFDLWNTFGWLFIALLIVGAAAGYVALLVSWPVPTGLASSWAAVALSTWWVSGRNLRAELEAVRARLATYNASETHAALAEAKADPDPEPPAWMDQSGYRRPCNNCGKPAVFVWETDGFPFAACNFCVSLWFDDGLPDHVVRLPSSEAECNIGGGTSTPNETNAILHRDARPLNPDPCVWSDDGTTTCGDPSEGTVDWPGRDHTPLCADHLKWARTEVSD